MHKVIWEIPKNSSFALPYYVIGAAINYVQDRVIRNRDFMFHQLSYCVSGTGYLEYEGKKYKITKDMVFFYSSNIVMTYYPESEQEDWVLMWITFQGNQVESLLEYIHLNTMEIIENPTANCKTLFKYCYNALNSGNYLECSLILQQILYEIYLSNNKKNEQSTEKYLNTLLPIIHYINIHYSEDLSLSNLSGLIGVSDSYLCRIFKKTFHQSPIDYLNTFRISQAKHKLINSPELSVEEIAHSVGYKESGYFCKAFKNAEKLTPGEYRKKYFTKDSSTQ